MRGETKREKIFTQAAGLVFIAFWCLSVANGRECQLIKQYDDGTKASNVYIRAEYINQPGRYCLRDSIADRRVYAWAEGGEQSVSGSMLRILSSNVDLDLQGHQLVADGLGANGIDGGSIRICIRNGMIKSRTSWGVKLGDLFPGDFGSVRSDFTLIYGDYRRNPGDIVTDRSVLQQDVIEPLSKLKSDFPKTSHKLSDLAIEVGSADANSHRRVEEFGIGIKGAANEIRGNHIVVNEGHAGVYLFGPNQLIENNTIIFKGGAAVPSGAPIKLHLADNSIIRNNTIIIEGSAPNGPQAAISLVDSKNVVIESNKVVGTKTLYKIWDEEPGQHSSVILGQGDKANVFVPFWKRLLPQAWW